MKKFSFLLFFLLLQASLLWQAETAFAAEEPAPEVTPEEVTLEEVADGVWAALQPREKRFNDSNSVVIVTERDLLVVDSQSDDDHTRGVIAAVRKLSDLPVRFLINTHWHSDHTQGNYLWREAFPGIEIIAAKTVQYDIPDRAAPYLKEQIERWETAITAARERFAKGVNREGAPLTDEEKAAFPGELAAAEAKVASMRAVRWELPSLGVEGELVFERKSGTIRLHSHRAHTSGDLTIWLPLQKVLITGDLLDELPFAGHGFLTSWVATLDRLATMEFEHIIPGHGGVLPRGYLQQVRTLLTRAQEHAAKAVESGQSLEEFQASTDFDDLRELFVGDKTAARNFDGFLPDLLERAWREANGELLE